MQQHYDRLKQLNCVISILTLFIVIAEFRPVNRPKNVSTDIVVRAKRGTEPGVHKLHLGLLSNSRTIKPAITSLGL